MGSCFPSCWSCVFCQGVSALFLDMCESDSGNTQFCGAFIAPVLSGTETEPNGAQVHDAAASPGAIETDLENAQFDGAETELGGDVSESVDVGQSAHYVAGQTCGFAGTSSRRGDGGRACAVQAQRARCAGVKMDGVGHRQGRHDVLDTTLGRAAGTGRRAMRGLRGARGQRAEAGSLDSFDDAFLSCRTESPSSRVARVTSALHNLCPVHSSSIPAHNSHARMLHARCVVNSVGDTEDGGRLSCVYGGTKSTSTSTRTGVRCPAVEKLASPQQAPGSLHDEMWAGIFKKQGPKIFRDMEIVPGCAVRVARPSCPDYSPEPPGPGRIIRNMLGWSLLEETARSGVWVIPGCPPRGETFFSP